MLAPTVTSIAPGRVSPWVRGPGPRSTISDASSFFAFTFLPTAGSRLGDPDRVLADDAFEDGAANADRGDRRAHRRPARTGAAGRVRT